MDATSLGELDPTVMYMNFLHRYVEDPRSSLCLWIAAPGFPFQWRMVRHVASCICLCTDKYVAVNLRAWILLLTRKMRTEYFGR